MRHPLQHTALCGTPNALSHKALSCPCCLAPLAKAAPCPRRHQAPPLPRCPCVMAMMLLLLLQLHEPLFDLHWCFKSWLRRASTLHSASKLQGNVMLLKACVALLLLTQSVLFVCCRHHHTQRCSPGSGS